MMTTLRASLALSACAALMTLAGCATQPAATACPSQPSGYVVGQTSSDDVRRCMGAPAQTTPNTDGRYVLLYHTPQYGQLAFLFDAQHKLVLVRNYQSP